MAATIPFSASQGGAQLSTDAQGDPQTIRFAGFGSDGYVPVYLSEGEWATGTITFTEDTYFGSALVMPYSASVRNIYVLYSTKYSVFIEDGASIYPFVCLAVSNSSDLVFTILQNTLTYTEPYIGGVEYPKHTLRRGASTGLNIGIPEGTLTAIVLGIRGMNTTEEQFGSFTISGGIFLL